MTHRAAAGLLVAVLTILLQHLPSAAGSAAPGTVAIAMLRVDIWPEHDDPRVLVIYRGTLSPDTPLPYTLAFSVPAAAVVHAAAYSRDGQLFTAQYQTVRSGDQAQIAFAIPVPDFQFEYYVDVITPPPQRTFEVNIVFPLPVANLQVSVEQPLRASGFALAPTAGSAAASGAFTYHLYADQAWPAGKPWRVRGTYRKEDTVPSLTSAPAVAQPPAPTGGGRTLPLLLTAVVGLVAGIVGALLVGYLRRSGAGRRPAQAAPPKRPGRHNQTMDEAGRQRFCANCGKRAAPNDRFCSNCGQSL